MECLSFIASTVFFSIAHGSGGTAFWKGKYFLIGSHMLLVAALCGIYALPAVVIFWYFFRRSWHAEAELYYCDHPNDVNALAAVRKAYPFPIGHIAAAIVRYAGFHRWKNISHHRRQQEYLLGWAIGSVCSIWILIENLLRIYLHVSQ